jgi:hypothetical protein
MDREATGFFDSLQSTKLSGVGFASFRSLRMTVVGGAGVIP